MKRQSKLDGERVLIVALVRFSLSVCLRGRDHVVLFLWGFFFFLHVCVLLYLRVVLPLITGDYS